MDDEPLARSNLSVLLKRDPEIEIIGECGSGMEAVATIRSANPDLVFLDVQMPECDGFDVLEMLGVGTTKSKNFCREPSSSSPHMTNTLCAPSKPERSTTC